MTFLAPLFLAGLAAVAIPVLVHLTHRPRQEAYAFPSLMFLGRLPFRTTRRQRIRHWWLLGMRAGFVALVTAAFARPLLERWGAAGLPLGGGRELVVLLDNSYSMGYGNRWQRAIAAARRVVNGLGSSDRATIVLFSDRAQSLHQATADRGTLLTALDGARLSFGATRYGAALQLAHDVLDQSDRPRREVVLISDFQRAGWRADQAARLPAGTSLERVDLSEPRFANLAVTGLLADRDHRGAREEVTLSARIANLGGDAVAGLPVGLEVDGRPVQSVSAAVGPQGTAVVRFRPLPLANQPVSITVRAGSDPLPVDNQYHAVVAPGDVLRVLLIVPLARGEQARYLRRALAVSLEPRFELEIKSVEQVKPTDLAGRALVVLLGTAPRLAGLVDRGGAVLAVLGGRGSQESWGAEWRALLGGTPGPTVESTGAAGVGLAVLHYDHPIFEAFRGPRSGDFGSARVYRYRRFQPAEGTTVLAQYDDGSPALLERRSGSGRKVLTWTSDFDDVWTDLPVQPVFLPLAHQILRYLAGYTERRSAFTVGQLLDLDAARQVLGTASDVGVETPSGRRIGLGRTAAGVVLEEPGFYTLRAIGERSASRRVAVNLDPAEADLTPLDQETVAAAVRPTGSAASATSAAPAASAALSPAERERRQGIWWYLVMGAVVLALAETLLSNRLPAIGRVGT